MRFFVMGDGLTIQEGLHLVHVVIYVAVVTFLMTLFMNKFTSKVMDDWDIYEIHSNYWNKVSCVYSTF